MNIVQINETCGTGSIGRLALELSNEAVKQGHKVLFAYSTGIPRFGNAFKIGNNIDHKFHALMSRITGLQGYYSYIATKRLIRKIEGFSPDIIHLENLHSNYINLPMLFDYIAKNDIPTVITLHDCWFYTGKCTYYVPAKCQKWKVECERCPLLHIDNVNKTFLFDRTKKSFSDKKRWFNNIKRLGVVGVSEWASNEAKFSFLGEKRIITIRNWVNFSVFRPISSNLRDKLGLNNKRIILMVSTYISNKKGYQEMIGLSRILNEEYQIIVVGKNNGKFTIPDNVIHIEHTNNENELAMYYSMADVCVNTTKYETFGLVTAEALSCGTPVVVYNNTASPELIGEECGRVVEEYLGIEGILEAITELVSFDRGYIRQACLAHAHTHFDMNEQIKKYLSLYQSLQTMKED